MNKRPNGTSSEHCCKQLDLPQRTQSSQRRKPEVNSYIGSQDMELNEITGQIVDAAIKVHSALGTGLLESAYEACLICELTKRGLIVHNQAPLPVH